MEREVGPAYPEGTRLDAEVARVVFGLADLKWWKSTGGGRVRRVMPTSIVDPDIFVTFRTEDGKDQMVASYSTTGDGCLLVIERMLALGWEPLMTRTMDHDAWAATFSAVANLYTYGPGKAADTLPHAVCLAALAALEPNDGR